MRAENLTAEELKRKKLFEEFYKELILKWFLPSDIPAIMIKGQPGSGKTFLIRKVAQKVPLQVYGLKPNGNESFKYALIEEPKQKDAAAIALDDMHYFSDVCRWNQLNKQKPDTFDFVKTLERIVNDNENQNKKLILMSDRPLCDLASPIASNKKRKRFFEMFADLARTSDDAYYFKQQTEHEPEPKGYIINFRGAGELSNPDLTYSDLDKKITPYSKELEYHRYFTHDIESRPDLNLKTLEMRVRKQFKMIDVPFVFSSPFTKPSRKPDAMHCVPDSMYRVPSLASLGKLSFSVLNRHCNVTVRAAPSQQWLLDSNEIGELELCPIRALEIAREKYGQVTAGNFGVHPSVVKDDKITWYAYDADQMCELYHCLVDLANQHRKWPEDLARMVENGDIEKAFTLYTLRQEGGYNPVE